MSTFISRLRHTQWWPVLYISLVSGLLFAAFGTWGYDDPYITYRYAANLAAGNGLVYNLNEAVLSTTTPLFALLLGGLRTLGADIPRTANLISAVSVAVGGYFLWSLAQTWRTSLAGWAALLLYPTFPLLAQSFGSETPLYLTLSIGALLFYARGSLRTTAIFAALAALTRGDGILVGVVIAAHYLIRAWRQQRSAGLQVGRLKLTSSQTLDHPLLNVIRPILIPAGLFMAVLLPWAYIGWQFYGSPLPATLASKQGQALMDISLTFAAGLGPLLQAYGEFPHYRVAALLVLLGIWFVFQQRQWMLFLAWPVLYTGSYMLLGVPPYFWYYAPLVPLFVILTALGIAVLPRFAQGRSGQQIMAAGALIAILGISAGQVNDLGRLATNPEPRYSAYQAMAHWINNHVPEDSSVGMLEVGIMGYAIWPRPIVDFAGLIQPDVTTVFAPDATYQDTAAFAIREYQPDFVVLTEMHFKDRADDPLSACRVAATVAARDGGFNRDLLLYDCREE
jgi:hypothetical protein